MNIKHAATPAWAFALQHLTEIQRLARKPRFRRYHVDPDEFVQDVVTMAVERFCLYDPARGTPKQWLFMLAMAQCKKNDKRAQRADACVPVDTVGAHEETLRSVAVELCAPAYGRTSAHHADVLAQVAQLLARTTPDQLAACATVLQGMDGDEVRVALGISGHGRNFRLKKLREAMTATL